MGHTPESWSPAADVMAYSVTKGEETTLWTLSARDRTTSRFADVISVGVPTDAAFSPDGRWIAYQTLGGERYGEASLYVQPFPPTGTKYEIVKGGRPMWSPDAHELFFVPTPTQFMAVSVRTEGGFAFSNPIAVPRVFGIAPPAAPRPYDILPDHRFVAVGVPSQPGRAASPQSEVVVNSFEELKRPRR